MGCGCKSGSGVGLNDVSSETQEEISKLSLIKRYSFRILTFLFAIALVPLLLPLVIWVLFKSIVLTENINLFPLFLAIGKKLKKMGDPKEDEEEDIDIENINPEDYELVGVEDDNTSNNKY